METGRLYNKERTALAGTGLSASGVGNSKVVSPPRIQVETASGNPLFTGEDDSQRLLTGPGDGAHASASGSSPKRWGWTAPSGSRVEVNDSPGAERIEITHHSGAGVVVESDGGVFVTSTSARGAGLSAPRGDIYIAAGGELVLSGPGTISINTRGDLNLVVGGTLNIVASAINMQTNTLDETIDGSAARSVTNDQSVVIGGISRMTVAGDAREQVSGAKVIDVGGAQSVRTDGNYSNDVGGSLSSKAGGTNSIESSGDVKIIGGNAEIHGGTVTMKTGTLISPDPTGSPGGPDSAGAPAEAQVVAAEDIVDSMTTARRYPQYPGNGMIEHAQVASLGMIEHDETPGAADVYNNVSGGNSGNMNPSYPGGEYTTLPEEPVNRPEGITSVDPGKPVPARGNSSAKISKYWSLSNFVSPEATGNKYPIPPAIWDRIVANFILCATNVMDPIREKFPGVMITSAYRTNSKNHVTGRAVDLQMPGKSLTTHAEIARFARDNLPVEQVFLERSNSGATHVHLMVTVAGAKGNPQVMTCGDSLCKTRVSGIVVEYLERGA